jgi:hypothetical protein
MYLFISGSFLYTNRHINTELLQSGADLGFAEREGSTNVGKICSHYKNQYQSPVENYELHPLPLKNVFFSSN